MGFAQGTVGSNTVLTPWTYNACVPFSSYSEGGTLEVAAFSEDSSNQGIEVATSCRVFATGRVKLLGSGSAAIPTAVRIMLCQFTPGTPATTNFDLSTVTQVTNGSGTDNELTSTGLHLVFNSLTSVTAGQSYGLGLQAAGAAANWLFTGSLKFNYEPANTDTP